MRVLAPVMLVMALVVGTAAQTAVAAPPNLVLIVTDNQSERLLGAYGNTDIRTPHIDALASQGMRFDRAYATSGVCSPTRATLLTGLIPSQHGVHNGLPSVFDIDDYAAVAEFRNLPQTLSDAGYATGLVGKYHLGVAAEPQLGFDYWVTFPTGHTSSFHDNEIIDNGETYPLEGEHLTDFWTRKAEAFLKRQSGDRPFFLYLTYNGPYNLPPLVTKFPQNRHAEYYADNVPEFPQEPVHPFLRQAAIDESSVEDVAAVLEEYKDWAVTDPEHLKDYAPAPENSYAWQTIHALNNKTAMIHLASQMTMLDDGVGRVLDTLREQGVDNNTIVVFTSDQSSAFGQHGLWGNSSWARPHPAYREHMQVPLIVRQPGVVPEGTSSDRIIDQFDLFPTILDLVGLGQLEIANTPGRSFAAMLRGEEQDWEDAAFFEYITVRSVVEPDWKFVKRLFGAPSELYDLATDPGEYDNLFGQPGYEAVTERLDAKLDAFFERYAEPRFDPWRGGTAKAVLMYTDKNEQFEAMFPDWQPPFVEKLPPFSDR